MFSKVSLSSLSIFSPEVVTAVWLVIDYSCGPPVATHSSEMSAFGHKPTPIDINLSGPPVPYWDRTGRDSEARCVKRCWPQHQQLHLAGSSPLTLQGDLGIGHHSADRHLRK